LRFMVTGLVLSAASYLPLFSWIRAAAPEGRYAEVVVAIFVQILFVTMVYGPTAAYLVELFPPQVRYTGISIAYHLGTGVFGGFTPLIALAVTGGGTSLAGLVYPMTITTLTAIVALLFLRKGAESAVSRRAWETVSQPAPVDGASAPPPATQAPVTELGLS
jgi:MFS family permease